MRLPLSHIVAACLSLAAFESTLAQDRPRQAESQFIWKPRRVNFVGPITPAQKAAAIAKLEAIEQIFRRVPELANPDRFTVQALYSGVSRRLGARDEPDTRNVFEYLLNLDLCNPRYTEHGCGSIEVRVNFQRPPNGQAWHDEQGREIYVEADRSDSYRGISPATRQTVPFATETYYSLSPTERSWVTAIFAPAGELPWAPVSRAEYYNAVLFDMEGKNGEKLADFRKANETSVYQQWLAGAAERKQLRETALAAAAGAQPAAEVARLRKELEDTERETGEKLKAEDAADPNRNKRNLAVMDSGSQSIRDELARMSPDERRRPAVLDARVRNGFNATGFTVVDDDGPGAMRILTPNLAFWRARKSAVEARGIQVHISASTGAGPPPPNVHHALWQTFKTLDWAAIRALLDTTR